MALDVLEFLMGVLCQQNTIGQCQQFVSEYSDPVMQTIYFFFFPTVFVILFIHVLSSKVAENIGAKFRIMIAVAIFVFIVVQGWYYFLLTLSRVWFISIIVLGGLWAFLNMGLKKDDRGSMGAGKIMGSVIDYAKKRTAASIRGDENSMNGRIEREKNAVESLESKIRMYEERGDNYAASNLKQNRLMKMQEIEAMVGQLGDMTSYEGTNIGKSKFMSAHKKWLERHSKK